MWTEPVTAQVMMTLFDFMIVALSRCTGRSSSRASCSKRVAEDRDHLADLLGGDDQRRRRR